MDDGVVSGREEPAWLDGWWSGIEENLGGGAGWIVEWGERERKG